MMVGMCLSMIASAVTAAPELEVPLSPGVVLRFASLEEGRRAISRHDDFTRAMSKLDVQIRLRTDKEVTPDDYLKFVAPHVTEWKEGEREKLTRIIGTLRDRLKALELAPPFPAQILLVRTSGLEEAQAAYTRGTAIFLPASKVAGGEAGLSKLMAHELFHVLSRNAPKLRDRLYAIIGFHPCPPVEVPHDWRDRKLTNPDAPGLDTAIEIQVDDKPARAVSFLYSREPSYEPKAGDSLFRYLEFRLMVIDVADGKSTARLVAGQPLLVNARMAPAFQKQIGSNTGYIIHADEIMADNFMHLLHDTQGLPSPEIVEKLKMELGKKEG